MSDSVTLTRAEYESLIEELEDLRDIRAAQNAEARIASGESEYLSIDMVEQLASYSHPVRVWREYRSLTAPQLAAIAGIPQSYLSEIETRKKPGSVAAYVKLARALKVRVDDLIDDAGD